MNYNLKNKKALCIDYGSNINFAMRLGREDGFGTVYYHVVRVHNGYPTHEAYDIGRNVPGITIVEEWASVIDEVDIVCFPDVFESALQEYFVSIGKAVMGSKYAGKLEYDRIKLKHKIEELDLPIGEYFVAIGMDELESILKVEEDVFVKTELRGDGETWCSKNYALSKGELERMRSNLGAYQNKAKFVVERRIKSIAEVGIDSFCVDGDFPKDTLTGVEIKDCYDDKTEVLTDVGWKLFKDLDKSEKVFTLNISDKRHITSEYQHPTDYIERNYNGQLVYIEKDSVSLCITPTHNVLVQDGIQNEDAAEVQWRSLGKGRVYNELPKTFKRGKNILRLQKINDVINRNKRFSLLQPKSEYRLNKKRNNFIRIGNTVICKNKLAVILGLYLSEGHVKRRCNKSGKYKYEINISQFKYVEEFEKLLKNTPYNWSKVKTGFSCYDDSLGAYLYQFGLSKEKFIPQWLKESSRNTINTFLNAYCLGDGTFITNYKRIRKDSPIYNENYTRKVLTSRSFYTTSRRMADDLQELVVKIGSVSVSRINSEYYNNKEKKVCLLYGVEEKLINRKNYVFPKDVSYVDYFGKVYCVTVPNSIIMIRRNGKSMWCGNCFYAGKIIKYDSLPRQLKKVSDKFANTFRELKYRSFHSNEVIIGEDKQGYLIDLTQRIPSPPGDLMMEIFTNFPEIIWNIANGIVPELEYKYTYGVQFIIKSDLGKTEASPVIIPDEYKDFVKIKNLTIDDDGICYYVPLVEGMCEIGAVVGVGNSMREAVNMATKIADSLQGFDIKINTDCIGKVKEQINRLKEFGVHYLD